MKIVVYGKPNCPWCDKAKTALDTNGFDYIYINIESNGFDKNKLVTQIAPGAKTVPVVMINDGFVGGYDQLENWITLWREDVKSLHAYLRGGLTVSVEFTKADGTTRVMRATTNPNKIPVSKRVTKTSELRGSLIIEPKPKDETLFVVFDLDKNDWRSFKAQRVLSVVGLS